MSNPSKTYAIYLFQPQHIRDQTKHKTPKPSKKNNPIVQSISPNILLQNQSIKKNSGNPRGAIRLMKKMKLKQHEQQKVAQAIETMEAQSMSIESALENAKLLNVLQQGADAMKSMRVNEKTSVESFDNALSDIRETMDYAAEIQEILTTPVSNIVVDDAELLQELEELGDPMDVDLPAVPSASLPSVQGENFSFGSSISAEPVLDLN